MDFDPNAPAFGPGAQALDEKQPEVETDVKTPVVEAKTEETPEEESKVPYSRFKKFHDEAKQYAKEAAEWKAKAEASARPEPKIEAKDELPDFWVELYGDSDASRKAWKVQSQANSQLVDTAKREALEAVKAEARAETERVAHNLETIDEGLEGLGDYAGKALTEDEQSAVLDIVDEYSPKDEDGNYVAVIPFEKAWDIYQMKQETSKAPKIKSRNQVASLTNTKTSGDVSVEAEKDKNFNPLDWNSWKSRL